MLTLDIAHKWNHSVCGLLLLVPLTWQIVFKVHLCCDMYQYFIPFALLNNILLYGDITLNLSIHQMMDIWVAFWPLKIMLPLNMYLYIFVWPYIFISLEYGLGSEFLGLLLTLLSC